jgi:hypothetical protein
MAYLTWIHFLVLTGKGKAVIACDNLGHGGANLPADEDHEQLEYSSSHEAEMPSSSRTSKISSDDSHQNEEAGSGRKPSASTLENQKTILPVPSGHKNKPSALDTQTEALRTYDKTKDVANRTNDSTVTTKTSFTLAASSLLLTDVGSSEQAQESAPGNGHLPDHNSHLTGSEHDLLISTGVPQPSFDESIVFQMFWWQLGDPVEPLRQAWSALLEAAAHCMEEEKQGFMLKRVNEMMGWCVDAGIGVKYGKKV